MPRHPPIALKTLDRSHCRCPSSGQQGIRAVRQHVFTHCPIALLPHCRPTAPAQKDQLLEIGSGVAVRQTHQMQRIERPLRRTASLVTRPLTERFLHLPKARLRIRNPNKSSLYDVMQNRRKVLTFHKLVSLRMTVPSSRHQEWWSRTGSNRRHPACKAGALPAELRPLIT